MWDKILKIWSLKDFRKRVLYTLFLLLIFRILAHIPVAGVDLKELQKFFSNNEAFGLLNMFSGGAMKNFSIVMMGVGPYITSSIIFQLLVIIVPSLEALNKEGDYGRKKINHYTRIATVPLAVVQSYAMIILLKNQNLIGSVDTMSMITMLISLTAGTMLLMWIGELISENGLGNGISLIISLGIIGGIPQEIRNTLVFTSSQQIFNTMVFIIMAIVATTAIVYINDAQRQIPITYARRIRGNRSFGGVETYLPIKVTMAGVIPIIFAISLMVFPPVVARFFESARTIWIALLAKKVELLFNENNVFYAIAYFVLVVLFTFFYTSVIFQPNQVAENLQKQGGFIPGIRPGKETAEYVNYILYRVVLIGAVFLGLIAILPIIAKSVTSISTMVLGGTGILIVVSVVLETARQVQSQITMRTYDNY